MKLTLQEILEEIDLHEATEDNKQMATVIVIEIFRKKEKEEPETSGLIVGFTEEGYVVYGSRAMAEIGKHLKENR